MLDCYYRERNKGLYTADRLNPNNEDQLRAITTRTEQDYYPYWHPTVWRDIAVITDTPDQCDFSCAASQNVEDYGRCWDKTTYDSQDGRCRQLRGRPRDNNNSPRVEGPNNQVECEKGITDNDGTFRPGKWIEGGSWDTWPPDCEKAPFSRDNHLGNAADRDVWHESGGTRHVGANRYRWKQCVPSGLCDDNIDPNGNNNGQCLNNNPVATNQNERNNANCLNNCKDLNAATGYFDGGLVPLNPWLSLETTTYSYMSTRNNDFSNRSQKGSIVVHPWKLPVILGGIDHRLLLPINFVRGLLIAARFLTAYACKGYTASCALAAACVARVKTWVAFGSESHQRSVKSSVCQFERQLA
ncbi:hypothetical protein EMIHUDRAFT_227253 [Emiliania huxleyi CCMP1516]|uniref:Apple domain-containing protein n=2 Tax=Emiliania huxleyi TaxID=2903 RepID=A0A0D3KJ01_EMIH1|nr:hypothetical protein EMIHUDRAFT_227253 [Emiliania huxleyi CCMP1516]EOD35736.1 hypothetical protein EMIHUDRAFT_227253 [Emiliania huxleyi CCMP1516]|eukprot:XP_005788165.1 hypothetical protein EMIHUDRAFT_227253 [Emiliania huxleyi CCMP1516]